MWLSPAVSTGQIAGIDIGCHLHTTMTLYAVECTLVAGTIGNQTLLGPMADLDSTMLPYEVILLLREPRCNFRLDTSDWTLHMLLLSACVGPSCLQTALFG